MRRILTTAFIFISAVTVMAEGYQVNMQSQKQTGMGHTGAGQRLGATSIHFNPGAMAFMPGKFDFSLGASGVLSKNSFVNDLGGPESQSDNPMGTPLFFYGAMQLSDKMAAGIGVTSPYGNSLKWGDDWQGKYLIQDISLQAIFVTPTLAYKLTDRLSVGAGFVMAFGGVDMNQAFNLQTVNPGFPNANGQINLKGNTTSYGFTAGLFYEVSERISAGLSYRSKVLLKMEEGDVTYSVPSAVESFFPTNNSFSSELPMPSNFTFGIGWQANEKWFLAFDLQAVGWSAYESLDFDFELTEDKQMPKNYENTMIYRLGTSYAASSSVVLRAGVYYDQTPIQDEYLTPETPGTNKVGASLGLSWLVNDKLSVDASLLHIMGEERSSTFPPFSGTYNTSAWLPGLGISYTF